MAKQTWKPGNMIYPLPAAMVSVGNEAGETNIITIAGINTVNNGDIVLLIIFEIFPPNV